jgi:hypothetical protein
VRGQQHFQNFLSGSGNAGAWAENGNHTGIVQILVILDRNKSGIIVFDIFISLISNRIHHGTKNKSGIQPTIKVDPSAS